MGLTRRTLRIVMFSKDAELSLNETSDKDDDSEPSVKVESVISSKVKLVVMGLLLPLLDGDGLEPDTPWTGMAEELLFDSAV